MLPTAPRNITVLWKGICHDPWTSKVYKGIDKTPGDDNTGKQTVAVKVSQEADAKEGARLFEIVGIYIAYLYHI
jgi:hypothetical protein